MGMVSMHCSGESISIQLALCQANLGLEHTRGHQLVSSACVQDTRARLPLPFAQASRCRRSTHRFSVLLYFPLLLASVLATVCSALPRMRASRFSGPGPAGGPDFRPVLATSRSFSDRGHALRGRAPWVRECAAGLHGKETEK